MKRLTFILFLLASPSWGQVVSQSNSLSPANSVWIGRQTICPSGCTSTGLYTPTTGTNGIDATCVAGGASGGGTALTGASQVAASPGGSSGAGFRKRFTSGFSGVTFTIGVGGAAPSAGANAGNAGGNTSVTINAVTYTATGGSPGSGAGAAAAAFAIGTTAGGTATNGDLNVPGGPADGFANGAITVAASGRGGDTPFGLGTGGKRSVTGGGAVAGSAGTGYGAGGSGAAVTASQAAQAGGAGTDGICVVDEYR